VPPGGRSWETALRHRDFGLVRRQVSYESKKRAQLACKKRKGSLHIHNRTHLEGIHR